MDNQENFIRGIFNYCDRWCERCALTTRCRVFADERSHVPEDSLNPMGDALKVVAESLTEASKMLTECAEEMGIDLEGAMNDPDIDEIMERSRRTVEAEEACQLSWTYSLETRSLLNNPETWVADQEEDPLISDTLEVIGYYLFSIGVKVKSTYRAALDEFGYFERDQIDDPQSYVNGTAKITLIIIERSILGWTSLMNNQNADLLRPVIDRLERIRNLMDEKFPIAREFIRPGFDELEMIM